MREKDRLESIISCLEKETRKYSPPLINLLIEKYGKDPFLILIATLLSLRSRDAVTWIVVQALFEGVKTAQELVAMPRNELENIIFKTGFYRQKAATLQHVSAQIIERFQGQVPADKVVLSSIAGIGPKTANLVLGAAFDQPAICVDVHVHRISNRLGLITTKTVEETEKALEQIIPQKYWINWNTWLVIWGQNICLPRRPRCAVCPLKTFCDQKI
jgi:endonuclease-3